MPANNVNARFPDLAAGALAAVESRLGDFAPPLAIRLAQVKERIGRGNGAESVAGALSVASATPVLTILDALRQDYGLSDAEPGVRKIAEATLWLYFYVRAQDDLVDEPDQVDRAIVYAMQVLYDACQRAFSQALDGSTKFFEFQEAVMAEFAGVALWEVDEFREGRYADADITRIGGKFLPGVLPLGALAIHAGRESDLGLLRQFVVRLGTGLQFVNDILNIREDHKGRRLTPVLSWLYESGRVSAGSGTKDIRLILITDPALRRGMDHARQALQEAEKVAQSIGARNLAALAKNRTDYLESVPHRLFALHLGVAEL